MRPSISAASAGSSKPSLSRANHSGAETAAKMSMMIARAAMTGSIPLRQRAM